MLIKKKYLISIIKNYLNETEELEGNSGWGYASDFDPTSQATQAAILEEEGIIPYVYSDYTSLIKREDAELIYGSKIAMAIFDDLEDLTEDDLKDYGKPLIDAIFQRDGTKWPFNIGKMSYPPKLSEYEAGNVSTGFPTIGIGHLIYKSGERDERSQYKKYILEEICKKIGEEIKMMDIMPNSSIAFYDTYDARKDLADSFLMPNEEIYELYESDLESHATWSGNVTQPITLEMFNSLLSVAFNAGPGSVGNIVNQINAGNYQSAQNLILTTAANTQSHIERRERESNRFDNGGMTPPPDLLSTTTNNQEEDANPDER